MIRSIFAVFLILLLNTAMSRSEDKYQYQPFEQRPAYGGSIDLNFNQHNSDITHNNSLEGCPTCSPVPFSGNGFGIGINAFYSRPLFKSWDMTIRLGFNQLSGVLTATENEMFSDGRGGHVAGVIEHSIDASISSVALQPMMSYRASDQLSVHLGLRLGTLLSGSFDNKEEITSPSYGYFEDTKLRTRNKYTKDIPKLDPIDAALVIGASYDLPIGATYEWFLVPEAFYALGFTPVSTNVSWTVKTLSVGVGLKYAPRYFIPPLPPPPPPPPPPIPPPPPPPEVPVLEATIAAVSVDEKGVESNVSKIVVEEFLSRRIHPLLDYVFFDENSAEIPAKYIRMDEQTKKKFSENYLSSLKTMDVYYQILNIVGRRMFRFPQTEVTLVGCNADLGPEKGNNALSKKRADAIKNFLVTEWNIDEGRIKVESRNLPVTPSNNTQPDGQFENRRVEILSDNEQIFEPLTIRDTVRHTNPPLIRFKPKVKTTIGIAKWQLVTAQGEQQLKVFEGKGQIPDVIELDLSKEQKYVPVLDEPFQYKLVIIDNDNKSWESAMQELPIQANTIQSRSMALMDGKVVDEKEFDRFSLISFGYNKWDLTKEHLPIIKKAKDRIITNSKVDIEGHTDQSGDETLNQKLSEKRALSTAKGLNVDPANAKGYGEANPIYTNDTPEGRFYNRTVYIQIESTIEQK